MLLIPLFLLVALLYAAVGLGGGSSYVALLAIFNIEYELIPTTALLMNVAATTIASYKFWRGGHMDWNLTLPFLVASLPMAWLGGSLALPREVFLWLLTATLILVAARIYLLNDLRMVTTLGKGQGIALSVLIGAVLGFIAGSVGIGGGIYLVPLIILFGLGSQKQAAAAGAVFVWLNSLAGLASRVQRGAFDPQFMLPLVVAVIIGAYIGAHLGAFRLKAATMEKLLGVIILVAIGFLLGNIISS